MGSQRHLRCATGARCHTIRINASRTGSGRSDNRACPDPGNTRVSTSGIALPNACVARTGVIASRSPRISNVGHLTCVACSSPALYSLHALRSVCTTPSPDSSKSRSPHPNIHMPGVGLPPRCAVELCPQKVNISRAACSLAADVTRSASLTGMGADTPTIARDRTRSGCRAAVARATREPMLWPITAARASPATRNTSAIQSAICSMDDTHGPADRPCPGRSMDSTLNALRTKWRAGNTQIV